MATTRNRRRTGLLRLVALVLLPLAAGACLPVRPTVPGQAATGGGSASVNDWSVGLYRGSMRPADIRAHEQWLGRPIETVLEMIPHDSWSQIAQPTNQLRAWKGLPYDVVFTAPMLPNTGASLAAGAAGAYDAHWRSFAETFVREGRPDARIRLGHEMNHTWYPWRATGGREADYAAYFRRIVTVIRSVPGSNLRFTWNVLSNATGANVEAAYPGDAFVDVIGLDLYDDGWAGADFEQRWIRLRTQRYGLDWLLAFATKHGKPMSFDEWALVKASSPSCRDPRGDSGDDTVYVNRMIDFFETERVAYANYFDVETRYGCTNSRIMNGPYPNATAAYRRRLLATDRPAATTTTTRPPATTTTTTRPPTTTTTTRPVVTVPPLPLPVSDEFQGTALDRSRWTYVNAAVDSNPWVGAGDLTLIAMPTTVHDTRPGSDASVRVTQPAGTADFVAEARFTSKPTGLGTWQGLTATVGTTTVRYAVVATSGGLRVVGDVIAPGGRTVVSDRVVTSVPSAWVLRLQRVAATYTMSWSADGLAFGDLAMTTVVGAVTAVGPAVGNGVGGVAPARHDAWVDYVRFLSVS